MVPLTMRCLFGVTRMERVRKEYIRRTARAEHWDEVREARLRYFLDTCRGGILYCILGKKCEKGGYAGGWCDRSRDRLRWRQMVKRGAHRRKKKYPNHNRNVYVYTRSNWLWLLQVTCTLDSGLSGFSNSH